MLKRWVIPALGAGLFIAGYLFLLYAFFVYLWPRLPPWATLLAFIGLAVFAIGSPIFWLLRLGAPPGGRR